MTAPSKVAARTAVLSQTNLVEAALLAGRGDLDVVGVGGVAAPVTVVDGGGRALLAAAPVADADGVDDAEEAAATLATPEQVGLEAICNN